MIIGYGIRIFAIPSIYDLNDLILIPFNYLGLKYAIINPIEKNKDIHYSKNRTLFMICTSLFSFFFLFLISKSITKGIYLVIINTIELFLLKPPYEKIEEETKKNIQQYFANKKN